ncbi:MULTISPECIES: TetR/AcrR family transcriptional regulator [unclassified Adlercreutzia]|uniref:TetR/AcrR family transcriptional regulator n=1 Tax=unclassified Adlercreutzia TaxID=2636013 RepID=UPI0013ED32BD|nr:MULTISPECIES: TetR/AcrR family transcriptional regulator [unclassified Adlercreutzia]
MGRLTADLSDVESRILDATIELQSEKAYGDISVVDICKRAGVSRQTYYRHYEGKEDVYLRYLDDLLHQVFENEEQGQTFDRLFESLGKLFAGNRQFLSCLFKAGLDSRILFRFERLLVSMGSLRGFGSSDRAMQAFIAGGVFNVMKRFVLQEPAPDAKQLASALKTLALPVVVNAKERQIREDK